MRRTIALILIACTLCVGLWFAFRSDEAPPPGSMEETARESTTETPQASGVVTAGDTNQPAREGAEERQRDVVDAAAQRSNRRSIQVRVVDAATDTPIPHAEVVYQDPALDWNGLTGADLAFYEKHEKKRADDAVIERFGLRTRADADGRASIPITTQATTIRGRHEDLYGLLYLDPRRLAPAKGWVLRLEPDLSFEVVVKDTRGEPLAGIGVAVRIDYDRKGRGEKIDKRTSCRFLGTSRAPDGIVEVAHMQSKLSRYGGTLVATRIVPFVPGLSQQGVEIPSDKSPTERIVLTVPATGSITVELHDEQGTPILSQAWIQLKPKSVVRGDRVDSRSPFSSSTRDGTHTFPHVALGLEFDLSATASNETEKRVVSGPNAAAQVVTETVTFGKGRCILTGRALRENGEPLANTSLVLAYWIGKSTQRDIRCSSDAEGRFQVFMSTRNSGKALSAIELIKGRNSWSRGSTTSGKIEKTIVLTPGSHDIGDLFMHRAPILVAGRIVGGKDEDFADVSLTPEYLQVTTRTGKSTERWSQLWAYELERASPSEFSFHATSAAHRWRLRVYSKRHTEIEPIEFRPGMRDLEIKLERGTSFDVTVLTDSFVEQKNIRLVLLPAGSLGPDEFIPYSERGRGRPTPLGSEPGKLRYYWQSVTDGRYDLVARLIGCPEPLAVQRDLSLPDSAAPLEIDLRGRMRQFVVRVATEDGKPTDWGVVLVTSGFQGRDSEGFDLRKGKANILSASASLDLVVLARGLPETTVLGVSGDTRVTLRTYSAHPVHLEFVGLDDLPAGTSFMVQLTGGSQTKPTVKPRYFITSGGQRQSTSSWTRRRGRLSKRFQSGPVELTATVANKYKPSLYVQLKGKNWVGIDKLIPESIEVLPDLGVQRFKIEVPKASLEKVTGKTSSLQSK